MYMARSGQGKIRTADAGLDAIQEQQPYKGLSPGMLQALSQLGRLIMLRLVFITSSDAAMLTCSLDCFACESYTYQHAVRTCVHD